MPYAQCTNSAYKITPKLFNNKLVYKRIGNKCLYNHWYIYYFKNYWRLSFESPFKVPTIGVTTGIYSKWPWSQGWIAGAVVTPVKVVNVKGSIPLKNCGQGEYIFTYENFQMKPVYKRTGPTCLGRHWYLYFNENKQWHIGYYHPSNNNHHCVTAGLKADWPWDDVWPKGTIVSIVLI